MSNDKLSFVNTADDEGEWVINKELYSIYFFVAHLELVKSETSDDIGDDPVTTLNALPSLHPPVRSSFMTYNQ